MKRKIVQTSFPSNGATRFSCCACSYLCSGFQHASNNSNIHEYEFSIGENFLNIHFRTNSDFSKWTILSNSQPHSQDTPLYWKFQWYFSNMANLYLCKIIRKKLFTNWKFIFIEICILQDPHNTSTKYHAHPTCLTGGPESISLPQFDSLSTK